MPSLEIFPHAIFNYTEVTPVLQHTIISCIFKQEFIKSRNTNPISFILLANKTIYKEILNDALNSEHDTKDNLLKGLRACAV
jgi:hypothetical protein